MRLLLLAFEGMWLSEQVPGGWEEADVTPVFEEGMKEDLRSYGLVGLTAVLGDVVEHIILQRISKRTKDKKVTRSSQHGFMKVKSCLTNLTAFCSETTSLA